MAVAHKDRIDRLNLLRRLIPRSSSGQGCPDARQLLARLAEHYEASKSDAARVRAIQRDLDALVKDGCIEAVNPGGKPQRYRRKADLGSNDPRLWAYAQSLMRSLIRDAVPEKRLERILASLREEGEDFGLGDDKLCILSDTQRLLPADFKEEVLLAALEALAQSRTLQATYRDGAGKQSRPELHPQALLQRGPRLYLFALKNDEAAPLRMYALHRFTSAKVGEGPGRRAEGFCLQEAIRKGQADFAGDGAVQLELRVRGYVADLLRDCRLSADQVIEEEPDDSPFSARVRATVPETGQLLRWLLGCGANVEVLAPAKWREVVISQLDKMRSVYGTGSAG
ncbi:helix-turn-helix transcriptional regulator [Zoogloea sp.]|uniref:helix-turn-helix transcriptional regulator n=1 Tax=Zoogloea sp. TaxID=49181 RepID=UPI0035B3BB6D